MLSVFLTDCEPKGQSPTPHFALLYAEKGFNECVLIGWWVESRGGHLVSLGRIQLSQPHSPLPSLGPTPPHPASLQLWKLVP